MSRAELPPNPFGRTPEPEFVNDGELVARIITAYKASLSTPDEPSESFWDGAIAELNRDVHEALLGNDIGGVQSLLRDPGKTDLFYGFNNIVISVKTDGPDIESASIAVYQHLLLLAEAIGERRLWNPEPQLPIPPLSQVDELLSLIDQGLGLYATFPNPFPGEIGLATSR